MTAAAPRVRISPVLTSSPLWMTGNVKGVQLYLYKYRKKVRLHVNS